MKHGFVEDMRVRQEGGKAEVDVTFVIDSSVLYEFMDCLMPVDKDTRREPIAAILNHSRQEVDR